MKSRGRSISWGSIVLFTLFFLLSTLFIKYSIGGIILKDSSQRDLIIFSYSTGGFGGTQTQIRLDIQRQVLELKESKQTKTGGDYKTEITTVPFNDEILNKLMTDLDESNFWNWKNEYGPRDILDGTYWSVRAQEAGGDLVESRGKIDYPEGWKTFSRMLSWLYKSIKDIK